MNEDKFTQWISTEDYFVVEELRYSDTNEPYWCTICKHASSKNEAGRWIKKAKRAAELEKRQTRIHLIHKHTIVATTVTNEVVATF